MSFQINGRMQIVKYLQQNIITEDDNFWIYSAVEMSRHTGISFCKHVNEHLDSITENFLTS
jgi:hypothetical protein